MQSKQKVDIIPFNPTEVVDKIYTACRTCYMQGAPQEQYEKCGEISSDKKWKLIKHVIDSGHHSTLEHVSFTFLISGVSRALSHQLVRHRIGVSYSQQSQRYCKFDKGFEYVTPPSIKKDGITDAMYHDVMVSLNEAYKKLVDAGIPAEDARMVLPNACCTNLTVTMNLRELIHFCQERRCVCAQQEIRTLANSMAKLIYTQIPNLKNHLGPKCHALNFCPEDEKRTCGRRPTKQNAFKENYNLSID